MKLINASRFLVWVGRPRDKPTTHEDSVGAETRRLDAEERLARLDGLNHALTVVLSKAMEAIGKFTEWRRDDQARLEKLREEVVEAWHKGAFGERPLHDCLQMTEAEYAAWVQRGGGDGDSTLA